MVLRTVLPATLLLFTLPSVALAADPKPFPNTPTKWQGFARHDFKIGELEATVVVPEKPLPSRPVTSH